MRRIRFKWQHILAILVCSYVLLIGWHTHSKLLAAFKSMDSAPETSGADKVVAVIDATYSDLLTTTEKSPVFDKGTYINTNGFLSNLMGQRVLNNIIKLDNGVIVADYRIERKSDDTMKTNAGKLIQFYQTMQEQGIPLVFVLAPYNVCRYDPQLPAGLADRGNESGDVFLNLISAGGVPYIDLREELHKDGLDHYDMFFKTDHHWKPWAGFWAYTKIYDYLFNAGLIEYVDDFYFNMDNYHTETYPEWFLGTAGKRTGTYFAGVDDFSFLYPKFDTHFVFKRNDDTAPYEGEFKDALLNTAYIQSRDYFNLPVFDALYANDLSPYHVENPQAPADKTALIIQDSFGRAMDGHFATLVRELHVINRLPEQLGIENIKPDFIIMLYNNNSVDDSIRYNFVP